MPLRDHFPIFQTKTYLNSCSHGALSTEVRAAYLSYLEHRDRRGGDWEEWVGKQEVLRGTLARLLNAAPSELALVSCLSGGLNALANAIDFSGPRNKVLVTDFDFPTTAQIWRAQESRGAVIESVPCLEGELTIPPERFAERLDESTLILSLPQVCYRNGAKLDVAPIVKLAREKGARVFLDCYQSVGAMPVDVHALDVDFAGGGLLKYLISSSGMAFLYVKAELIDALRPTTSGWFSQADINAMDSRNEPAAAARRFESGTPNVPNIYAAIAGLELLDKVGVAEVERHVKTLTAAIKERARERGFTLGMAGADAAHGPLVTLRAADMHQLVATLAEQGIIVSCRAGNLRVSPHFYNSLDDVESLFQGLDQRRDLLA